ncbi:MAG: outer membrane protein assembly factor BamE (lipoprotein component of BamABCDE complex) [Paraglaciecola sp.]|jgi:outer membrane protein assembly factor BamE (lipoprotein component of BamABCDE complex)
MNKKVLIRISFAVALYAFFVVAVLMFYPDKPQSMDWKDREEYNKIQVSKLELGVGKQQVLAILGSPDISEAKKSSLDTWQVMFYRTQHVKADGITTQDECTALLLKNDVLVAWGDSAYQDYIER